jgi:hypothetical protein
VVLIALAHDEQVKTITSIKVDAILTVLRNAAKIVDAFNKKLNSPIPDVLAHYTSLDAALSIIKSGCLYASELHSVQDQHEIEHGVTVFYTAVAKVLRSLPWEGQEVFLRIKSAIDDIGARGFGQFYIACLSANPLDSYKWQHFGDQFQGCALVFDGPVLEATFQALNLKHPVARCSTYRMLYDDARLHRLQSSLAQQIAEATTASLRRRGDRVESFREIATVALSLATLVAIGFKQETYAPEDEYRLMIAYPGLLEVPLELVRLRSGSEQVRYIPFSWHTETQSSLREVLIGPNAIPDAAARIRDALAAANLKDVTVRRLNALDLRA